MAVVQGTVHSVQTLACDNHRDMMELVQILFTVSGTYAQADNAELASLAALIKSTRRNGRKVVPRYVMGGYPATKQSDNTSLTLKGVAMSGSGDSAKATFEIAGSDFTTEIADGAVPAQNRPFALLVAVTPVPL